MFFLKQHADWLLFVLLALVFLLWPELDLVVSHWFYDDASASWPYRDNPVNLALYGLFRYLPYALVPLLMIGLGLTFWSRGLPRSQRKVWLFLLLTLLIGPGILVHNVFKEGFERPRPKQVVEFGGKSGFSPAFVIADQCHGKCRSFVSGHSAMGFWLMVFAWWSRRKVWLYLGVAVGVSVSVVRITQGGHFLSDTIFAGFICYFIYRLFSYWLLGHSRIGQLESTRGTA